MSILDKYPQEKIIDVMSDLSFISKITKNDKVGVRMRTLYSRDSYFTKLIRTIWMQESREDTRKFVYETVNRAFEVLKTYDLYLKSSEQIVSNEQRSRGELYRKLTDQIRTLLRGARYGIENIREVYSEDLMFVSNISSILTYMDAQMQIYKIPTPSDNVENSDNYRTTSTQDLIIMDTHNGSKSTVQEQLEQHAEIADRSSVTKNAKDSEESGDDSDDDIFASH